MLSAPWPGRCSPTPGSDGANTTSTPPSQSSASSYRRILRRRSWARTRSCAWPCATSTSWCSCWRARAASRPATPPPPCSPSWEETWSSCTRTPTPGPRRVTPTLRRLDPAVAAPRPGRTGVLRSREDTDETFGVEQQIVALRLVFWSRATCAMVPPTDYLCSPRGCKSWTLQVFMLIFLIAGLPETLFTAEENFVKEKQKHRIVKFLILGQKVRKFEQIKAQLRLRTAIISTKQSRGLFSSIFFIYLFSIQSTCCLFLLKSIWYFLLLTLSVFIEINYKQNNIFSVFPS